MATSWTDVSPAALASIGTTAQNTAAIACAPNEGVALCCVLSAHATASVTVKVQASIDGTNWADTGFEFLIAAGDVAEKDLGFWVGRPNLRVRYVASNSTDLPTATTRAKRGPLNGA